MDTRLQFTHLFSVARAGNATVLLQVLKALLRIKKNIHPGQPELTNLELW